MHTIKTACRELGLQVRLPGNTRDQQLVIVGLGGWLVMLLLGIVLLLV